MRYCDFLDPNKNFDGYESLEISEMVAYHLANKGLPKDQVLQLVDYLVRFYAEVSLHPGAWEKIASPEEKS